MSDRVSLQNIRLGIADIYLNNKQIGVIQRVERGEASSELVGKWFANLYPLRESTFQELMNNAVAWGVTRKECLEKFDWKLRTGRLGRLH